MDIYTLGDRDWGSEFALKLPLDSEFFKLSKIGPSRQNKKLLVSGF
jgi:hypothetical protein